MRIGRVLLGAAAVPLALGATLAFEVMVARNGGQPPPGPPRPDGAPAGLPGAPVEVVAWLGDSTGAGLGAAAAEGTLPAQAASALGRPVTLTVLATSGATVADVLADQVPRLGALGPTAMFITVGANDTTHLTTRASFRRDYRRVIAGLPATVSSLVLLGVPDMGAPPRLAQPLRAVAGWRGRLLDADVRQIAAGTPGAVYVDIAGRTGQAFRHDPPRYFARDRFHPNDAGYHLWARAVAEALLAGEVD